MARKRDVPAPSAVKRDEGICYVIDFGHVATDCEVRLRSYDYGVHTVVPAGYTTEVEDGSGWRAIGSNLKPIGNTENLTKFSPVRAAKLRVQFHASRPIRIAEIEVY